MCQLCFKVGQNRSQDRPSGLLVGVFYIFSVGCLLFISYIAIDHSVEKDKLKAEIDDIEKKLETLKETGYEDNPELNKAIKGAIESERRCDTTHAIIRYISKQMDEERSDFLKIWSEMPMAFLNLVGDNLKSEANDENVDKMDSVTGWKSKGGISCSETNPSTDGSNITIPRNGNYSVNAQITFYSQPGGAPIIHRHAIQRIQHLEGVRRAPLILMENAYQIRDGETRVSFQSGVYSLSQGDSLRVLVKKSPSTLLHNIVDKAGVDSAFSVFLL